MIPVAGPTFTDASHSPRGSPTTFILLRSHKQKDRQRQGLHHLTETASTWAFARLRESSAAPARPHGHTMKKSRGSPLLHSQLLQPEGDRRARNSRARSKGTSAQRRAKCLLPASDLSSRGLAPGVFQRKLVQRDPARKQTFGDQETKTNSEVNVLALSGTVSAHAVGAGWLLLERTPHSP